MSFFLYERSPSIVKFSNVKTSAVRLLDARSWGFHLGLLWRTKTKTAAASLTWLFIRDLVKAVLEHFVQMHRFIVTCRHFEFHQLYKCIQIVNMLQTIKDCGRTGLQIRWYRDTQCPYAESVRSYHGAKKHKTLDESDVPSIHCSSQY